MGHFERLSPLDAAFLYMETPTLHMHVGGLFVFDGANAPAFDFARFVRLVRSRIHLVPRYRQKLAWTPLNLASPAWVDDPNFDLAYHVRHAALPPPGTEQQLTEYAARILSRQLDRSRPLWELYVIEGLQGGRFAILGKTHHAMIDGVAGMDMATMLLDLSPDASDHIPEPQPWEPQPPPKGYELAWDAVRELITAPGELVGALRRAVDAPGRLARRAVDVAGGVLSFLGRNLPRPAPPSPLNGPPGMHRRFAIQHLPLDVVKRIKNTFHTTVNDVVLAVVADATGRYLRHRGHHTDGLWLKAMVPVSVRSDDERYQLGNRVTSVFVSLPMFEMDPVERLQVCHEAMRDVKEHHDALGAEFLVNLTSFAPPTIHAVASRLAARARLFNFLVTNVPGPQVPIYCMGAPLLGAYPFTPLAANHLYAVGIVSTLGRLNFGITADYDRLADIDVVPGLLVAALEELARSADAAGTRAELARKPVPKPAARRRAAGEGTDS